MLTKNFDVAADGVQIHGRTRGRAVTGMNSASGRQRVTSVDKIVSKPRNLFTHEESLSGSRALPSQQGGNHSGDGLCYTQRTNRPTGVRGIRSQPVDQRGHAARVRGGQP